MKILKALFVAGALTLSSCNPAENDMYIEVPLSFYTAGMGTKSLDPADEEAVSNLNLLIFNGEGLLEEQRWYPRLLKTPTIKARLLRNMPCHIYAYANFGYEIPRPGSMEEAETYRYYLTYPDEYKEGIPMSGKLQDFIPGEGKEAGVPLVRMMSKISLRIDRSRLDDGTSFTVQSVEIGNCPRSAAAFGPSKARSEDDILRPGFSKSYYQTDDLNRDIEAGLSRSVSVYMLENMQGDLLEDIYEDSEKILEGQPAMEGVCSYIEIKAGYRSADYYSKPGESLIYRFYLGEGRENFDVKRNCHYTFTLCPEGSGIEEDGWRVDKSALTRFGAGKITVHPSTYIESRVGEDLHVWAETSPPDAAFEMGMEELEYDKERGIYDYTMDSDGRGVTLHLKNRGSGILYMEAGEPVSDSAAVLVIVN